MNQDLYFYRYCKYVAHYRSADGKVEGRIYIKDDRTHFAAVEKATAMDGIFYITEAYNELWIKTLETR